MALELVFELGCTEQRLRVHTVTSLAVSFTAYFSWITKHSSVRLVDYVQVHNTNCYNYDLSYLLKQPLLVKLK